MNFFSYIRVELNRIFRSKTAYVIMLLTMLCPIVGYKLTPKIRYYINPNMFGNTISCNMIANPCLIGALVGGVLFALLTLLEFHKVRKYQTMSLTNSIVSPLISNVVRVVGIIVTAIVSVTITALIYLPYTVVKMGSLFDSYTYLNCFFLFMLPSIVLSIIAASAFYQIFCRVDISMVLFIVFAVLSGNKKFKGNNIMHWICPTIPTLSDYFSNNMVFRLMQHNRLFWFLILGGLWVMTLLCVRSYGKGFFGSVLHNLKKVYIPLLAMVLIGCGCYAYMNQPSLCEFNGVASDELPRSKYLKLSNTDLEITFNAQKNSLFEKVNYSLENSSGNSQECILRLNTGYTIHHIMANDKEISFKHLKDDTISIGFTVPSDPKIKLTIEYSGSPKIYKSSSDFISSTNISDKYIDLKGLELCPNLILDNENKNSQITGKFTMPSNLIPIIDGGSAKLISENILNKTWDFDSMGGFFSLSLIAGDYTMKKLDDESMPVEFYYSNKAKTNMDKMSAEEIMDYTINYCKNHYGNLYNASENNPFKIVQGTAFYSGGLGLTNFSIMQETSFNESNLKNKLNGPSSEGLLCHEIVHQWWSYKYITDGENSDWTAEGLTIYTCYRIMKEKYGEEYAKENYVEFWKGGLKDKNNNFYNRHPEYLKILPEKYVMEINAVNRIGKTYMKMPLQIFKATELVGGDANMDKILAKLYDDIPTKQTISWQNFLDACGLKEEDLNLE